MRSIALRGGWIGGAAIVAIATVAGAQAQAPQSIAFDIRAQPLAGALIAFGAQSGRPVLAPATVIAGRSSNGVHGTLPVEAALTALLDGSGLAFERSGSGYRIVQKIAASDPPPVASNDIIVTAQKREQKIQDVPIAISAFSGKTLDAMKIETGGDLLKSIPNVTFSKNNFAGYNFSIRGIGTKAVAASTDPAVAVAFNSSNLIVNRLFEQEFYDIERVEVLRGPQGTLYGRNATAGVVNIISHKADLDKVDGFFKAESGSYLTRRLSGAVNLPIIEDVLAIRAAGAYTKRDGYAVNDFYNKRIDGRDLFSTRLTISAKPADRLKANLIWEHFNENDDRQRTGKQLCHKDDGPSQIGGNPLQFENKTRADYQPQFSQGCKDGSLYDDAAYSTPNGRSLNAYEALATLAPPGIVKIDPNDPLGQEVIDPYGGVEQSRNLRHYSAVINPRYKARADVFEANATFDLGEASLISQLVYDRDHYYSTQDYNRYVSVPIFGDVPSNPNTPGLLASPMSIFVDPQLGPSDRFVAGDLIRTNSRQVSQEVRIQSNNPSSRFQYVVGGNYTSFHYDAEYNVFVNTLTYLTQAGGSLFTFAQAGSCDAPGSTTAPGQYVPGCVYTDSNPIGVGLADGHNISGR